MFTLINLSICFLIAVKSLNFALIPLSHFLPFFRFQGYPLDFCCEKVNFVVGLWGEDGGVMEDGQVGEEFGDGEGCEGQSGDVWAGAGGSGTGGVEGQDGEG